MASIIPAVVEKHLDCVHCWDDGKLLLGSSNLTGRYWNGSLWCFQNIDDAPDIERCLTGVETESGICDIVCLKDQKAAIGLDSGTIEIYQLDSETPLFTNLFYACEHDDAVSSLSVNSDGNKIVSGSYDKCIKVWDLATLTSTATYRPVHAGIVWQVACSTTDPHVVLSCSQDGRVLLLDLRLPKPATALNTSSLHSIPTAVAWQPQSSTVFAIGDDSGNIVVKDLRDPGTLLHYEGHKRSIFRLAFSTNNPSWLASCADATDVRVTDIGKNSPSTIYHNDSHSDFIRGLSWSVDNSLITCGWDKNVLKHVISPCKMDVASPNSS